MASIQKTSKGYRAQIKVSGVRDSRLFSTKREASQWAAQREAAIREGMGAPSTGTHTLRDAYRDEGG